MLWNPLKWKADKGYPHAGHRRGCRHILADFAQPLQADCKKHSYLHAAGQDLPPDPWCPWSWTICAHCWLCRHWACSAYPSILVNCSLYTSIRQKSASIASSALWKAAHDTYSRYLVKCIVQLSHRNRNQPGYA